MDTATNKILHAETIDKREVQLQSPNMEREGILCALIFFCFLNSMAVLQWMKLSLMLQVQYEQFWVNVNKMCFCLKFSVCMCVCVFVCVLDYYFISYLATYFPDVHHSMDVWHKSKKLKQALAKVTVNLQVDIKI